MTVSGVIDFRCRPPIAAQKLLFDIKLGRLKWENKFVCEPAMATSASMYKVGQAEGLDLLLAEMDEAGVDLIVMPGRNIAHPPKAVLQLSGTDKINVTDEMMIDLSRRFDNRAVGLHGIDVDLPAEEAVAAIETALEKNGMAGAVLEIGYSTDDRGQPLKADDPRLYPIYETMVAHDRLLMYMSGIYAGHDIGANDWPPLDRVMQDFPQLKLVLAHGGYPRVLDAVALAVKHPNFYLSPDIYCFFPGGRLYVEAIGMLPDQFIFASAYPFGPLKESVKLSLQFPLSGEVMEKYMYTNAARLLAL